MSEVQPTPEEIIEALPKYLVPEKAGATKAMIQFDVSGDPGGKWWAKIADGKAETGKGDAPEPATLTVGAEASDFVKIMTGQMDGMSAFMSRKLQIKGDMGLAVKLQTLFKRPS
jgi:putative sterol carrier protein